ncbi:hypothetical protein [Marinobacterium jannaschii]|uniref:hypothetical protein n=1 Tax=Marinobacterium jannaschii TaxID=64970 RepID=UPI0014726B47|nr:hypothetical protein [Marinobacterium jannaschii]
MTAIWTMSFLSLFQVGKVNQPITVMAGGMLIHEVQLYEQWLYCVFCILTEI